MQRLVIASGDSDGLFDKFLTENDVVLDTLLDLDQLDEFLQEFKLDMRSFVYEVKAIVDNSYVASDMGSIPGDSHSAVKSQVGEIDSI